MSNIILFPQHKQASPPQSLEEMSMSIAKTRASFIRNLSVDVSLRVFTELEVLGVDISKDEGFKDDMLLIHECIKSTMARRVGLAHPLQEYASKMKSTDSDIRFAFGDDETEND